LQGVDTVNHALLFACEGLVSPASEAAEAALSEISSGLAPSELDPDFAQAFNLSSRPASTKKIWWGSKMCYC
jgi:hypothetical protein